MRTRLMGSKVSLLFVVVAALLLAVAGTTMALTADPSGNTAPAPTIQSDEADYPPGATVTLTGSNWQPGESVHINVNDDEGQTWNRNVNVTADASGNVSDSFNLPDWFVATYTVTATGSSGTATTTFTDGNINVSPKRVPTTGFQTVNAGTQFNFVVQHSKQGGGQDPTVNTPIVVGNNSSGNPTNQTCGGARTQIPSSWLSVGPPPLPQTISQPAPGVPIFFRVNPPAGTNGTYTGAVNLTTTGGAAESFDLCLNVVGDTTAPTSTASATKATTPTSSPYTFGDWSNKDVSVTLNATDNSGGSGVKEIRYTANGVDPTASSGAVYSGPFQISSEGTTTLKFRAIDNAGNVENVQSRTVKIDKTAPSITDLGATSNPNTNGWYNTNVTNRFKASDSGSGLSAACIANFPAQAGENIQSKTTSGEGSALKVTSDSCTDVAGNTTTGVDSATVKVDKTAPSITGSRTPDANANDWNKENVTVSFSCSDELSGVPNGACPADAVVSSEGANQSRSGTVTDAAGNTASATVNNINIDKTAPEISCDQPDGDWHADNVTLECTASDGVSDLADASDASFSLSTSVAAGTEDNNASTGSRTVSDNAGNSVTAGPIDGNKVDRKAPSFSCPAADNDWHGSDVTLDCTASDGGSGLDPSADANFSLSTNVDADTETANASTGNKVLTDAVGNTVTAPSISGNKVDKKVPNTSASTGTYNGGWTNETVTATLNANDGGSGVKKTEYSIDGGAFQAYPNGGISVTDDGDHTILYRSTDNVDNQEQDQSLTVKVDKTAPEISCDQPDGDWHADNVTLECTASDGVSDLADASDASFSLSTSVAAGNETANASTDSRTVSDNAGNSVTAGPIDGNKIDRKAPEVVPGDVTNTTWRNSPLSESFTASDGGSGLANAADSSFTLTASAESANANTPTVVSREVKDAVGNTTTRNLSALIDLTNPNISASVVNNPAPSGWYNLSTGGPQVHFECGDALSGIEDGACPADHTITEEGPNVGYSDNVSDRAGNSASASVSGLKVDLSAPDVAGAPDLLAASDSGDPNDNLTNDHTPTFNVTAEAGSTVELYAEKDDVETLLGSATATGGVATITYNQQLADGTYNVYAKVTDQAGNVSSTTGINITIVTIDTAAPDTPGLDMAASSDTGVSDSDDKTNNDKPTFSGSAEAGSTLKVYDGADLITSFQVGAGGSWTFTLTSALSEGEHQIKATATDAADNTSSESQLTVVIDKTPPVISGTDVNDTTWRNTDLSVDFTSSDALSSLKPNQNLGANGSFTLTTSGESPNSTTPVTASKTVEDVAGNSATRTISALVDKTLPSLGIVDNNALSYNVCDTARPVRPAFNPTDTLSGLASSSSTWTPSFQPSGVGSYTYKAQATDNATNQAFYPGPTATEVKTYSVVYDPNYTDTLGAYSGVLQPVNLTGSRSAFKLGSTIPVKFLLRCGTTPITNAVAKLYLSKIDNVASAVNEPSATNSPDIGNQFRITDATTGQYQFNLSTKAGSQFMGPANNTVTLGEGTWYMYISLDDGAKFKTAEFDIKR